MGQIRWTGILCMTALVAAVGFGCVTPGTKATVTSGEGSPTIDQAQMEAYNGPKARVAVAQFKDKTGKGWWTGRIGDGMADQLTTALVNSNRFIVLERQTLGDVLAEQDLGASGRVRADTAAPIGQIEGAELLIVGAVTEFEGNASGAGGGIGAGGRGWLGALTAGFRKAHMAIDVRVIDARTSRVLAATSVEGEATDVNLGGLVGGYTGSTALAAGLGGWKNTPTEKALRICIQKAVEFIISKTPAKYYHIGGNASAKKPRRAATRTVPAVSAGDAVVITAGRLNVRSGPGTKNPVQFAVRRGDRVSVIEKSGGWFHIRTADGEEGWLSGKYTKPAQ